MSTCLKVRYQNFLENTHKNRRWSMLSFPYHKVDNSLDVAVHVVQAGQQSNNAYVLLAT
jgi:hypothetical protein